jgi:tRNA-2-methylthio-N6-dimethylallyladenosine synthase
LGQNVDSYLWYGGGLKKDFENATEMQKATAVDFDQLLEMVAVGFQNAHPILDFKPQDMHESVLHVIAKHPNICKHILPVQSEVIEF